MSISVLSTTPSDVSKRTVSFWSGSKEYEWLSNFYSCDIWIDLYGEELCFLSAEAAYQAHKVPHEYVHDFLFLEALAAKDLAKKLPTHDEWEQFKEPAMRRVLEAKFAIPNLRMLLQSTRGSNLVHWAPWDQYWGWCKDKGGENRLGKLLMELRDGAVYA